MNSSVRKLLNFKPIVFFIIILFFGFLLRAQEAIFGNYLFLIDQGRDMMAVKGIVFDNNPTLIGPYTSLQGVFQGPIWYYLLSIPTAILDGNPVGGVWLMVVLGISVIIVSYFWIGKQFGVTTGLVAAFLFAFSPQAIAAATFAWNPHPMWMLVLLYLIFFYTALYKNKKAYLLTFPLITLMTHFETALAVFIGISTVVYVSIFERGDYKSKFVWIGIILSLVFFLPQIMFDLRHNFLMTNSILKIFSGSNQGLVVTGEEHNYAAKIITHWQSLFNNIRYAFPQIFSSFRISVLVLISILAGITFYLRRKTSKERESQRFLKFVVSLVGINFLFMIFIYPFPLRSWFLTGMEVYFILIVSILIGTFYKNKMMKMLIIAIAVVVLFTGIQRIHYLYFISKDTGGIHKNTGKLEAIDYIYKDAGSKDFGLFVFTPPVYTYAYDYLIWWRSKTKYGYIPPAEKKEVFYLLMEVDTGNPNSYKGWMETVIKDGDTVKTVNLPSGFVVEKRVMPSQ